MGASRHRHPAASCKLARMPKSRLDFWGPKLSANRARDERNSWLCKELGWRTLVIWECELGQVDHLTQSIYDFLGERRSECCEPSNYSREQGDSELVSAGPVFTQQ